MLFNGIGITQATLRYCAQKGSDEEKKGYFLASLKVGILADAAIILLTAAAYLVAPLPFEGTRFQLLISACLPVFYFLFTDIQLLLRATFQNQRYSVYNFTYSFLLMIFQIVFAVLWGVTGVMVGRYISMGLCVLLGFLLIRDLPMMQVKALMPDWGQIKAMMRFSIVMLSASATSMVMSYNETFIVGQMLKTRSCWQNIGWQPISCPFRCFCWRRCWCLSCRILSSTSGTANGFGTAIKSCLPSTVW